MEALEYLGVFLGGLLFLLMLGVPVYAAFFVCNLIGVWLLLGSTGFGMFANSIFDTATSLPLITIPLFILMGEMLFRASAIDVLFQSIDTLLGRVRGRQYVLTIFVSTILAALSGASMAVAAMLGRSLLPIMKERGYDQQMSIGAILGGACLAPIIPPSVLAIIIGTLAQISIADILIAGIVPGLILSAMFLAYIFGRILLNPDLAPHDPPREGLTARDYGLAVLRLLPFTIIIVSVMGAIIFGIATPNEAAATGVLGAIVVAAMFGRLSVKMLYGALQSTASLTAMILLIMAASRMFAQLLSFTGASAALTQLIAGIDAGPVIMLLVLLGIPFLLCMFLDQVALMLILIPIYHPLLGVLGYDPLWFWILFLIVITVGAITPPFGYVLFALAGVTPGVKMSTIYRASTPYVVIFVIGTVILAAFPGLVTLFLN